MLLHGSSEIKTHKTKKMSNEAILDRVADIKTNKGLKAVVDALCNNLTGNEDEKWHLLVKEPKEVDESTEAKLVKKSEYDEEMLKLLTNYKNHYAKLNVKMYLLRLIEVIVKKEPKSNEVMTKMLDNTEGKSALEDPSINIKKVIKEISNLSFDETDQSVKESTLQSIIEKLSSSYELITKEQDELRDQVTSDKELEIIRKSRCRNSTA